MRMEAHLIGTPGQRHEVVRATVRQLGELMYAMAEIGEMYVSVTVDAALSNWNPQNQNTNVGQVAPPGEQP